MYRKLRNCANSEEKKLKLQYYCRLIEDAKGDSSRIWKAIKETLPSNHNEINAVFSHGKLKTDPKGIAETLNNHFHQASARGLQRPLVVQNRFSTGQFLTHRFLSSM